MFVLKLSGIQNLLFTRKHGHLTLVYLLQIIFVNSQHMNTNSKPGFSVSFKDFWTGISKINIEQPSIYDIFIIELNL